MLDNKRQQKEFLAIENQYSMDVFTTKKSFMILMLYIVNYVHCTIGWVNFSEFQITMCGSCKMSKKTDHF